MDKQLHSRRRFLTLVGATTALAACEKKGRSVIVPYTKRPQEVVPGVANFYASSFDGVLPPGLAAAVLSLQAA